MRKTMKTAVCVTVLACAAWPTWAALSDEIQVYTDDINAPGERGLEVHVNTTPQGRRTPDYPGEVTPYHGLRITPEFSWGLTHTMDVGLYLPINREPGGVTTLAGAKLRGKWMPVRSDEHGGWFFGMNGELSRVKQRFSESMNGFELRLMAGHRSAQWLVAVNPVMVWDLSKGYRGGSPGFGLSTKVARTVTETVQLGAEYYADTGTTTRTAAWQSQSHTLYGVADMQFGAWGVQFGIGRGMAGTSADKWTVKSILDVPF